MLLSIGGFISVIGDYLYNIAITITLYSITKSLWSVALMWLCRAVLRIPVQYAAGIISDVFNKKKIIVYTNLISFLVAFLLIYANGDKVWLAYIFAFLLQSLNDFDDCAEAAILPELVSKEQLSYANSIFSTLSSVSGFLSPALAGIIYNFYGSNILFEINSISFIIAGILFSFIKYNHKDSEKINSKLEIVKSGIEGYKVLMNYEVIKNLFMIACIFAILGRFYETYKVVVADRLLNIHAEGMIYFDYALAIGGLLVPVIIKILSKYNNFKVYIFTSIVIGIGYIIFGYSNIFVFTFIILIIQGMAFNIQGIYTKTLIQKNIPQEYIGRVFSFYKIMLTAFAIIGLLIANPLYKVLCIGTTFLVVVIIASILCIRLTVFNENRPNII